MPRRGKPTRRARVDLVDLMIRNRKYAHPYSLRLRSNDNLEHHKSESNHNDDKNNNNCMNTSNVNETQKVNSQQEPLSDSQFEPQEEAIHKPAPSYNLRNKSKTTVEDLSQDTTEVVKLADSLPEPPPFEYLKENRANQQSPPPKKIRLQDEAMEKKPNTSSKIKRKGTPRPTPKVSPKATPNPTRSKLTPPQKRKSRRSAPYKLCNKRAKWRSAKAVNVSSQTRNTQLMSDCKCADSASIVSGSRLYLAEVALQSTSAPRATTNGSRFARRLLTMQETQSTVVLHRNPNFKTRGARRSSKPHQYRPCSDAFGSRSPTMLQKKKQNSTKPQFKSEPKNSPASSYTETVSISSTTENSKSPAEESNSFEDNVGGSSLSATIIGVVGERKDQELRPPPPPPMLPHMAHHSCSLNCYPQLAAILHNMDNFLKSVTKSTQP